MRVLHEKEKKKTVKICSVVHVREKCGQQPPISILLLNCYVFPNPKSQLVCLSSFDLYKFQINKKKVFSLC